MKRFKHSASQGFTLIELMATIVVSMILLVTGGATYLQFQERQEAEKVATELQRFAVKTRARARSQDTSGCTPGPLNKVVGYSLEFNSAVNQVQSVGFCGTGKASASQDIVVATYAIPAPVDIEFGGSTVVDEGDVTATESVVFFSLMGGATVQNASAGTIDVSRGGVTYRFIMSPGGEISSVQKVP